MSSIGENYPVEEVEPLVVTKVDVINPGSGFTDDDIVSDNLGNLYEADIVGGAIIRVTPINTVDITELPRITITSVSGNGAVLIPKLGKRPPQEGVTQVIDCIV